MIIIMLPYVLGWKIAHKLSKNLLAYDLASSGRSIQWIRSNQDRVGLFYLLLEQQNN